MLANHEAMKRSVKVVGRTHFLEFFSLPHSIHTWC